MEIVDFIGKKVAYDSNGQSIVIVRDTGDKLLVDIRVRGTWSEIQKLIKDNGSKGAEQFQDDLGQWIADAINEKLERNKNECENKIRVEKFHKQITEWLSPLGYSPIFDNHPLSKEREFHFAKEGIRAVCVSGVWEEYCYIYADIMEGSCCAGVRTGKLEVGTKKLEELHVFMQNLVCDCKEQEWCNGPYNRCTKCGKLKSAFKI